MKRTGWLVLAVSLGATIACAQDAPSPAGPPRPVGWLLVPDKPYEATRDYNREQKLPTGKTLTLHETTKYWRDSAGRIRWEITRDKERVVWTYLADPTAKVEYRWNNESKVAYVTKLGDPIPVHDPTHPLVAGEVRNVTATVGGKRMKARVSLLEPKTIAGLPTIGTHEVAYSDDARTAVFATIDTWYQPEYHVTLEESIVDEQYGHRMWHFRSLKPQEAKADMFVVPKGYTLKAQETPDTEQFE